MENEFIRITEYKDLIRLDILNDNHNSIQNLILTKIEFDNLVHLILDNQEELLDKYCFERK